MPNPLYQMLAGKTGMKGASQGGAPSFQNPVQKMAYIMQVMQNPAAFVKQQFPDIPHEIQNNPGQIFNYLQQTRGAVSQEQIQQAQQMANQIQGQGTVR